MNTVFSVACFAAVLVLSSAHMCLIEPHQRGTMMDLNKEGADDCILLNAPCGGRLGSAPMTTFRAGMNATVIFQKNLDHWNQTAPGYFGISIGRTTPFRELVRVPDNGEKSLHLYTASPMVPMGMTGPAILQVTYVPKNSQAPAVFYQCADIMIQ